MNIIKISVQAIYSYEGTKGNQFAYCGQGYYGFQRFCVSLWNADFYYFHDLY
jgi:hypothetical protein